MMTSPYAGNGVGLQFPQDKSHRILFTPFGYREYSLIGPAYWANEDVIPKRDSNKDYRLTLPNATIYIKENGEIIIEQSSDGGSVPSGSGNYIKISSSGEITIGANGNIIFDGATTKIQNGSNLLSHAIHKHMIGNMGIPIPPHNPNEGTTTTFGD